MVRLCCDAKERIGDGLRFHALARVHDQQRAFARGKRARNFVGKIDVTGRVDQIELVFVPILRRVVKTNAFGLNGDAALALEVHRVEHLRAHLALAERAGQLEQAVGQRGLAVVNVRDDAKIADVLRVHCLYLLGCSLWLWFVERRAAKRAGRHTRAHKRASQTIEFATVCSTEPAESHARTQMQRETTARFASF